MKIFLSKKITSKKAKFYDDESGTLTTLQMANETNTKIKTKNR